MLTTSSVSLLSPFFFFFQAEDGIRDLYVTGVQTCALPIFSWAESGRRSVPAARLLSTPAPAIVNDPDAGMVAVPALFTVRPSIFEKNPPDRVAVPFRFVIPGPDIVPFVQFASPATLTVPGPV